MVSLFSVIPNPLKVLIYVMTTVCTGYNIYNISFTQSSNPNILMKYSGDLPSGVMYAHDSNTAYASSPGT